MRIIAGEARGRKLLGPSESSVRPPLDKVRGSIFSILGDVFEGGRVLDLFAGTGSFGIEALSRGAREAVFVENDISTQEILRKNVELTGFFSRSRVLQGSALVVPVLEKISPPGFALVFLDPPFQMLQREESAAAVFARVREILQSSALMPEGMVVLRQPSGTSIECPLPPVSRRTYGESTVLWLTRESLASPDAPRS
jgi:16S rRNA (guanine966-N2)-methyltransferase